MRTSQIVGVVTDAQCNLPMQKSIYYYCFVSEIDECSSNPCVHGQCSDHFNFYTCTCDAGYAGGNCVVDIDECVSNPCLTGNCTDGIDMYECVCFSGEAGANCDIPRSDAGLFSN